VLNLVQSDTFNYTLKQPLFLMQALSFICSFLLRQF